MLTVELRNFFFFFFAEFLVLPYFMERFVVNCLPGMSMLDYKIDYINHKKFNSSGKYFSTVYL